MSPVSKWTAAQISRSEAGGNSDFDGVLTAQMVPENSGRPLAMPSNSKERRRDRLHRPVDVLEEALIRGEESTAGGMKPEIIVSLP